jgi:hypothetical protein
MRITMPKNRLISGTSSPFYDPSRPYWRWLDSVAGPSILRDIWRFSPAARWPAHRPAQWGRHPACDLFLRIASIPCGVGVYDRNPGCVANDHTVGVANLSETCQASAVPGALDVPVGNG